jgi:transposase
MRPFGTSQQLAHRREKALGLLRDGQGPTQVAHQVGATPQSVCRWHREAQRPKRKNRRRPPGRPSRLSASQVRQLVVALKRGAYAFGYAEDYWTLDRIAHLIWELFRVRYCSSSVWYLLQRVGWSCQKPQRRSVARDEEAIAHWKHYVWPQIKKVAGTRSHTDFSR